MRTVHAKNQKNGSRGFTLIELMVVIALSAVVVYAVTAILKVGSTQASVLNTRSSLQESARDGLTRMAQEMRETAPSRITVASDSVSFQIPETLDANGNIVWSGDITYSVGGLNGTQLLRTSPDGTVRVVTNNVEGISFTANHTTSPTLVNIQLEMTGLSLDARDYGEVLRGEVKIRNE